jgi:CBS domain-containing protein
MEAASMKTCRDLMATTFFTLPSNASVLEAARMMREHGVGFVPICDPASNELVGVVTDRDLVTRMCADDRRPSETQLSEVAVGHPAYCLEESDVLAAEEAMYRHRVSRLVVVDLHRRPVGILGLAMVQKTLRRVVGRRPLLAQNL